jgi:hypothetical protein
MWATKQDSVAGGGGSGDGISDAGVEDGDIGARPASGGSDGDLHAESSAPAPDNDEASSTSE